MWCNADFEINKTMPAGTYATSVPNARQCRKPGGTGTVRLYGDELAAVATESTATAKTPAQLGPDCATSYMVPIVTGVASGLVGLGLGFLLAKGLLAKAKK